MLTLSPFKLILKEMLIKLEHGEFDMFAGRVYKNLKNVLYFCKYYKIIKQSS
jgi:hypothetical protein